MHQKLTIYELVALHFDKQSEDGVQSTLLLSVGYLSHLQIWEYVKREQPPRNKKKKTIHASATQTTFMSSACIAKKLLPLRSEEKQSAERGPHALRGPERSGILI